MGAIVEIQRKYYLICFKLFLAHWLTFLASGNFMFPSNAEDAAGHWSEYYNAHSAPGLSYTINLLAVVL